MDCRLILVNIVVGVRAPLFHMEVQWTITVYCKDHALPTDVESSRQDKPSNSVREALFWVLFCPPVPFLSLGMWVLISQVRDRTHTVEEWL